MTDSDRMKNSESAPRQNITAVILAGGRARRMGGIDKGLLTIHGKPMIEYVLEKIRPQVGNILISANRHLTEYQQYGVPVITDMMGEYDGPLAGMASGVQNAQTEYVVIVPCDSPLLPDNLVARLYHQLQVESAELAIVNDGERLQPVFALFRRDLLPALLDYLQSGDRRVDAWIAQRHVAVTDFSDSPNAFINVNSPEDQLAVEKLLG